MLASFVMIGLDVNCEIEGYIRVAISLVRQDGQDCRDRTIRQWQLTEPYSNQANRERFILTPQIE